MTKKPAEWRKMMTEKEARNLALAMLARDAAADSYNAIFVRYKNRCIQRLRTKRDAEK